MKIRVEVSKVERDAMYCESVEVFTQQLRRQLDDGIVDDEGGVGEDWGVENDLNIFSKGRQ